MKPIIWDAVRAKRELDRRLRNSKKYRGRFESQWEENERVLFNTQGRDDVTDARYSFTSDLELGIGDIDSSNDTTGVNYLFKNFRFIHAQMSANPPTVVPSPTSSDPGDRQKADAADRLIRHAIRAENMQEKVDQASAKTLLYGTGWMKTVFDSNKGDIVGRDAKTGEFTLEGKIDIYSPNTWDVWTDPNAHNAMDMEYVFERKLLPLEEAIMMFPEKEDILREHAKKQIRTAENYVHINTDTEIDVENIEIYEYWETGLPVNGMLGRFAICLEDGTLIQEVRPSPFAFTPPPEPDDIDPVTGEIKRMPPTARLPYHIFTDIDIPDEVYGKSFVEYEGPIQEMINRLDSVTLDNVQAHGVARMILPEDAEIAEDSITNSPWDIIKIKGNMGPHWQSAPSLMPEMSNLRDRLKAGGDDMAGVNESMFGEISRETSGFSLQYATNQGNMIRRRLFNKYTLFVENIYRGYLNLVRKYWDEPQIIRVIGMEKAFESVEIKGADIDGGYDLIVEYGASLSLDPTTRREEILQLMPLFEKAGIDNRTLLSMLKLNELSNMYDMNDLAEERQSEIFKEIIASGRLIPPRELQEHKAMLAYAYKYLMTAEFKNLPEDTKILIEEHIRLREQIAAAGAGVGMDGLGVQAPGPAPAGPGMAPDALMPSAAGPLPNLGQ
jgi:hypothetical protein